MEVLSFRTTPLPAPELRPKGLGLGASKIIKEELPKEASYDRDGKTLVLKTGALAKIIAGSHKDQYCEVSFLLQNRKNNITVHYKAIIFYYKPV